MRSQENRRVEILFFDTGEEPDLVLAESDSDTSEIYLPAEFKHTPVEPMLSAKPWRAEWDDQVNTVQATTERRMLLVAPGLPALTPVLYTVEFSEDGSLPIPMGTESTIATEGSSTSGFIDWFGPDAMPKRATALSEFPSVRFRFSAEAGGRRVASRFITYSDRLDARFTHDETGAPIADTDFTLHTMWGVLKGTTTEDGRVSITGIPPGGGRLVMGQIRLLLGVG